MWDYQYTSPTPEELIIRRQQLDAAGRAGLLPFLLLIPAILYRLIRKHIIPPRPYTSTAPSRPPTLLQLWRRRTTWLLNTTYIPEIGPLHNHLTGLAYYAFLLFLAVRHTGNDYLHLTKALGHVGASQLPLQYLLAFKTQHSPLRWATGLTHERLNAYHRYTGQLVYVLPTWHAMLYVNFFLDMGLLEKRRRDWDAQLGQLAFLCCYMLILGALPMLRKKAYHKLFYRSHVLLTAVLPVVLWFHVPYTRVYVGVAALLWVVNGVLRWSQRVMCAHAEAVEMGNDLLQVNLRVTEKRALKSWVPGQHVYLHVMDSGTVFHRKNPFTVVGVDCNNGNISLVMTKLAGTTAMLSSLTKSQETPKLGIEGPYGEAAEYLPSMLSAGKSAGQILLVAGGVGATYTLPIYLALLRARGDSEGLKMLWFVKQAQDVYWAANLLGSTQTRADVDVYVTGDNAHDEASDLGGAGINIRLTGKRPDLETVLEPLLAAKADGLDKFVGGEGKQSSRPLKRSYEPLTVMVCGPYGLSKSLRREVGKHVIGYGRDVRWYGEQFGFGGK